MNLPGRALIPLSFLISVLDEVDADPRFEHVDLDLCFLSLEDFTEPRPGYFILKSASVCRLLNLYE